MKERCTMSARSLVSRVSKGFTLIELLVVIGILAVLLAIVLVAINPAKQFEQANDTKRSSDINAILNAIHQYMADNKGQVPAGITTGSVINLSSEGVGTAFCDALVTEYIASLPVDPAINNGDPVDEADCAGTWNTGYTASMSASDRRITVTAPNTLTGSVSVTR